MSVEGCQKSSIVALKTDTAKHNIPVFEEMFSSSSSLQNVQNTLK